MGFDDEILYIGGGIAKNGFESIFSKSTWDSARYYGDDENDHYSIKKRINFYYEDFLDEDSAISFPCR